MKVLVVNNMAPFLWGGAESLAEHLQRNIEMAGHQSEILRIPFQWEPSTGIPAQMLMTRAFELWNVDHVVALKFPAYLIRHPRKTLWLVHQYRQAYDLFDAGQTNLPPGALGEDMRHLIRQADDECFRGARDIFTISDVTQRRLKRYNGFDAKLLRQPINDPERFQGGAADGTIFAGGRINQMKRQHLLVEAMAFAPPETRLIIAGPPDGEADAVQLRQRVEALGLGDRVKLDIGFLDRQVYADYVNSASAVACLPFDEDSLSYVAMEAANAGKPLISTCDSGGVLGLVKHHETGWVAEPSPQALAEAMSEVTADAARAQRLGQGARELWQSMDVTWPKTVEALLA